MDVNFAALLDSIKARDVRDSSRLVAPLVPADDAIVIDSSSMTLDAVVREAQSLMVDRSLK
jgi:cytidylate kinase